MKSMNMGKYISLSFQEAYWIAIGALLDKHGKVSVCRPCCSIRVHVVNIADQDEDQLLWVVRFENEKWGMDCDLASYTVEIDDITKEYRVIENFQKLVSRHKDYWDI